MLKGMQEGLISVNLQSPGVTIEAGTVAAAMTVVGNKSKRRLQ
jgi:hypothetical protein